MDYIYAAYDAGPKMPPQIEEILLEIADKFQALFDRKDAFIDLANAVYKAIESEQDRQAELWRTEERIDVRRKNMDYIYAAYDSGPKMPPQEDDILALVDSYQVLLDLKDELAERTKANNKAIEIARNRLAEKMVNEEVDKINRSGYTYTLGSKTRYSKAAGMDEELFALLRESGLGDLITETVNANTLSATLNQMAAENDGELPEEWGGVVNEFSYLDVSRRKDARKSK